MSNNPRHDDWLETYKSLVTISTEGFKFCAFANGGAAVAILAYLGNVVGKGFTPPDMSTPMAIFLAGLVLCGSAMLFGYFNQLSRLNRLSKREDPSKDWRLWVAAVLFISSLSAFACGSWQAVLSFKQFTPNLLVERDRPTAAPLDSLRSSTAPAAPHLQR